MLPFMKSRKPESGTAVVYRKPDEKPELDEMSDDSALEALASDLLQAIHSDDKSLLISCIRSMFEIMDSEPHKEGPHE